jgi:hypothetical protein
VSLIYAVLNNANNSLIGMAPILYTLRAMHALPAISMAIKGSENDE